MFKYAFFDLDGTLTQSEFAIINSVVYAMKKMGVKIEDRESVKRFIGPPLMTSFKEFYNMSEEEAKQATAYYREFYNAGEMFNAPLYEGIDDTLKRLTQEGAELYVVTSKPAVFAEKITENFDILKYFKKVVGPDLKNADPSKKDLIRMAMEDICGEDGEITDELKSQCIMIGDRHFDIDGAVLNNIASIGVLYGYGSREELEEAGATFIAENTKEVGDIVLGI